MTSILSPLPLAPGAFSQASASRSPQISDLPPHTPDHPARRRDLDVTPFGETHQPPPSHPVRPELRDLDAPRPETEESYTDRDLSKALAPLVGGAISSLTQDLGEFEAILRTNFRRALAQHAAGPFDDPGFFQRSLWRFDALLSSRSYEEILYHKTRRFRVEEVFLLDRRQLSLISFASTNPGRYASPRKVATAAHRVATQIREHPEQPSLHFAGEGGLRIVGRTGEYSVLACLIRGAPDPLTDSDLAYALRRIETRFETELRDGTPLLHELQPLLEECLLIQSPLAPLAD